MILTHLPKLLLQHDDDPFAQNAERELLSAAAAGRLHCCLHPSG
jgi:hypothetical protein